MAVLLFAAGTSHLGFVLATPELPTLYGDEGSYVSRALLRAPGRSLVPGRLRIGHRPQLPVQVFAHLARRDAAGSYRYPGAEEDLFFRVRVFHVGLLLVTLGCLYAQGRLLSLGPFEALAAPTLLALIPAFGFHVHAAWADVLRTCLLTVAFTLLLAFLASGRLALLVPAGLVSGYAVLARNSFMQFMAVALALIVARVWLEAGPERRRRRALRTAAAGVLFGAALLGVVVPQLLVGWQKGLGLSLAHNTWRNIEFGLRGPTPVEAESADAYTWQQASSAYHEVGPNYFVREQAARARALRFLEETPLTTLLRRQLQKLLHLLTRSEMRFEYAVANERWGPEISSRLAPLLAPSRGLWYAILVLGGLGMLCLGWRSPGWLLISLFSLYFLAGLGVASFVWRFMVPWIPSLCLLSGGFIAFAAARARGVSVAARWGWPAASAS